LEKEQQAEQLRLRAEKERAQKEQLKKQVKMQRKAIRAILAERFEKDARDLTQHAENVFSTVGMELDTLERLVSQLTVCDQAEGVRTLLQSAVEQYLRKPDEKQALPSEQPPAPEAQEETLRPWSVEEIKLLTKAVNMFPGGTGNRWQTIAEYISQHANLPERHVKEVMEQVKTIRSNARSIATTLQTSNQEATSKPAEPAAPATTTAPRPWSAQEQTMLENAIRKYPASKFSGAERWEKVASEVEGRTRSEVLKRVKELAALTKKGNK
jgi:DnaJ family protein C protein 2